ncbi:MAG: NCS2 family permease [Kyrpidia tusciae]|nr:NCS2 family permease [Kyrpidia tusciae]MBE3553388.1 NCS2 family permease [Kyrpidia tusciae]
MDRFFHLRERGTSVGTEILAGLTTFMTMAYILFLNPNILSVTGMDKSAVFFATAVGAGLVTILMGLVANIPVALAPGMGLNAYFAVIAASKGGMMSWQVALGAVFISGIIFIILTVTKIRQLLVVAVPDALKMAITVGIGLFITLIGLKTGQITGVQYVGGPSQNAIAGGGTPVLQFFEWNILLTNFTQNRGALLTIIGLIIIAVLMALRVRGALLIGILLTTVIGIPMGQTDLSKLTQTPMLPNTAHLAVGQLDIMGAIHMGLIEVVAVFTFVELFDTFGTLIGTTNKAGLLKGPEGEKTLGRAMLVDATGVSLGALLGTSTITAFVESASGVAEGGRTGLTAITTGVLFLLATFLLAPIAAVIPDSATAPALIIVGVLMIQAVRNIDFVDPVKGIPAFLTIALMPFTYSIANGISAGIVFYVLLAALRNVFTKEKEPIHWLMWILAVLVVLRYIFLGV